eukprot:11550434-Alexandrium_andersonii.AAC.1
MSASLVGSEMCIRDSNPQSAHPQSAQSIALLARKKPGAAPTQIETSGVRCLLYTSDAADDM